MTVKVRKGGAWRTITAAKVYANGAWRDLVAIKVYKSSAWRTVANFTEPAEPPSGGGSGGGGGGGGGTVVVSISPDPVVASAIGQSQITTGTITATPSGGLAPYTYSWAVTDHDHPTTINSPSLASTTVTATGILAGDPTASATLNCDVTDSLGVVGSATVDATFSRL